MGYPIEVRHSRVRGHSWRFNHGAPDASSFISSSPMRPADAPVEKTLRAAKTSKTGLEQLA